VAVLYVDNTRDSGVTIRRLRLGDHGELLDPWPDGFFDDSLADVLGGWE
jgi:predicted ATPase